MKHKLSIGIVTLLFLAVSALSVGQGAGAVSSLLFGQNQSYSAIVRSDGAVVTYAKILLNNQTGEDLAKTKFTAPEGVKLDNLEAYQVLLPERCVTEENPETVKNQTTPDYNYSRTYIAPCSDVEEQVFGFSQYSYYYDESPLVYKQINTAQKDSTYEVILPEPIKSGKRGAYIVAYSTKDYTKNTLGMYELEFKTLKVDQAIENIRVSVDVSNDLYTKVGKSTISNDRMDLGDSITTSSVSEGLSMKNSSLDRLQASIGRGGVFEKTGKSLVANETFIVKGSFADAAWKLYIWWIIGGIISLGALIFLTIFLLKKADASQHIDKVVATEKETSRGE